MDRRPVTSPIPSARTPWPILIGWLCTLPAFAEVISAPHGPKVDHAGNGVPVVNIHAPNGAGLSHNRYQDFNVDGRGLILNNQTTTGQTHLGGWVLQNPNLAGGRAAGVILNEVTSTHPSHLNGFLEVAGHRAGVIVSNPNGLTCNGCGFVNVRHGTLTTGVPYLDGQGQIGGYHVGGGALQIAGAGLDGRTTDRIDLIARAIQVNAGVWGQELNAIAGAGTVDATTLVHQATTADGKPLVAIDVSVLGGMYANRIRLVGGERGVGVVSAGNLVSQSGDLSLSSAGDLTFTGNQSASGNLHVDAAGTARIGGQTIADGHLTARGHHLHVDGRTHGGAGVRLQATQDLGVAGDVTGRDIHLETAGHLGNTARVHGTHVTVQSAGTTRNAGTIVGHDVLVHVGRLEQASGAVLSADGTLRIVSGSGFDNAGQVYSGQHLDIAGTHLSNHGQLYGAQGTTVTGTHSLHNAGTIGSGGALTVTTAALTQTSAAELSAPGTVTVHAGSTDNAGRVIGQSVTWTGASLANSGTIASHGGAQFQLSGALTNTGQLQAQGLFGLLVGSLDNRASIFAGQGLSVTGTGAIANSGTITTGGDAHLSARALANTGQIVAGLISDGTNAGNLGSSGRITLRGRELGQSSGALYAGEAIDVEGGALDLRGGTAQARDVTLTATAGDLDLSQATTNASGNLTLSASGALRNRDGQINANRLTIAAQSLDNSGGTIVQRGTDAQSIRLAGDLSNERGRIASNGHQLHLEAANLINTDGRIEHAGTGGLTVFGGSLANERGLIVGNGATRVTTGTLNNRAGMVSAGGALHLTGGALDNTGGLLEGNGDVHVTGTSLDNSGGRLVQRGAGSFALTTTGALTNANGGLIGAEGDAAIAAGVIYNTAGTIFAQAGLSLSSLGDLSNRQGQVQSNGALTVSAVGSLHNADGRIDAGRAAAVNAARIDNNRGQLLAGGVTDNAALTVTTSTLDNRDGTLASRHGDVALSASTIDNRGGRLVGARDLVLDTSSLDNSGGTTYAGQDLTLVNGAANVTNSGGQIGAGGTVRLTLARLSNTAGGKVVGNNVHLVTPWLDLHGGEIGAYDALHANLTQLLGLGRLFGERRLDARFSGDFTYDGGQRFESNGLLQLAAAGTWDNRGTLATQGALELSAGRVINTGAINASNGGGGRNTITAGSIDNQGTLEGDTVELTATDITNRASILGDTVVITADRLTNGRDLGTVDAAIDYGEGFIGASQLLELRIAERLANLDAELYSLGDLVVTGRTTGTRVGRVDNLSGRIQADGNASIAAEVLDNRLRFYELETYALSAAERYQYHSDRLHDAALTPAEWARWNELSQPGRNMTAADKAEQRALMYRIGYVHVAHVDDATLAALNAELLRIARTEYGAWYAELIDNPADPSDNPAAELKDTDTYHTGTRIRRRSADASITVGGDLSLDIGQRLDTDGAITAGRSVFLSNPGTTNLIQLDSTLSGERETFAWVHTPEEIRYQDGSGWHNDYAHFGTVVGRTAITGAGTNLLRGSITANQTVSIVGGNVNVGVSGPATGLGGVNAGTIGGPGSIGLGGAQGGANVGGGPVQAPVVGAGTRPPQMIGTPDKPLPDLVPPKGGAFTQTPDPQAQYLVETNPRFRDQGQWIASDYLLGKLGHDPARMHKRLGDGFYEQKLVLDQILQLTGRRYLGDHADALAQYRDLMDGAATEAGRMELAMGVALTAEQVSALKSDLVWMVEQEVAGQKVLVPVVYLSQATADKLHMDGATIAADVVDIQATGTVSNAGTIQGNRETWMSAETLINDGAISGGERLDIAVLGDATNRGSLSGGSVSIDAGGDFTNTVKFTGITGQAGSISAGDGGLAISAGRDLVNHGQIASAGDAVLSAGRDVIQAPPTIATAGGSAQGPAAQISSAGSTVVSAGRDAVFDRGGINAGEHAVIDAGRDAKFIAADVSAGGSLAVTAGRDIVSETVTTTSRGVERESTREGKTRTNTTTVTTSETVHGSTFKVGGDIAMVAKRDIALTAATVQSKDGGIALSAGRDLSLKAAQETHNVTQESTAKRKGTLSRTTTTSRSEVTDSIAVGTTLSGARVDLAAGNDLRLTAAVVAGDKGVTLAAGNDVILETGQNTRTESHRTDKKTSGAFSGGGVGFTVGKQKSGSTLDIAETYHTGTLVGSGEGRVDIVAGNNVAITGSDVLSNAGTLISGKNVTIQHAENTTSVKETSYFKQAGVNVSLKGGVADAAQTVYDSAKRVNEVDDDRLKGLYVAKAGQAIMNNAGNVADVAQGGTGGVNLRVGIGASSSSSESTSRETTAHGSLIRSNGDVAIVAREGNLTITGSQVEGDRVGLVAAKDLLLRSAQEISESKSSNKSSSGEIGMSAGTDGMGVYASASAARGKGNGSSVTHTETVIKGKQGVSVVSGGNTTLEGAQIIADQVVGSVGGNLTITSQQDRSTYNRKDESAGADVMFGAGFSGTASYSKTKVNSSYTSVQEQSGIAAGTGGFDIHVGGTTHLKGGVLASGAAPEQNRLYTGSLIVEHLENVSHAKVSSKSVAIDSSMVGNGKYGAVRGVVGNLGNGGSEGGSESSVTRGDIAMGGIEVRDGDRSALAGLDRTAIDLSGANAIDLISLQELQEQVEFEQGAKGLGRDYLLAEMDEAHNAMFGPEHEMYVITGKDENGKVQYRRVTEAEKVSLDGGADNIVHVAANGIFNDAQAAATYANAHSTSDGPQYFVHFPQADGFLAEGLVAGYQKHLEGDYWGLTNSNQEIKNLMTVYGQSGLHLDGHSRGSMTIGNAMESYQKQQGAMGALSGTTIGFFGPAYNAASADKLLAELQGRDALTTSRDMVLTLQNHRNDPVGRWIGGNPATGGTVPSGSLGILEALRALGGSGTSHNCYGKGSDPRCARLWMDGIDEKAVSKPANGNGR